MRTELVFLLVVVVVVVVEGRGEGWMGGVPPVSISPTRECLADENCAAGVELRKAIKKIQNPEDCANRKVTVWKAYPKIGIGAYLAEMANGFMEALCQDTIFLLHPPSQPWGFPSPPSPLFSSHSLFHPLSSCPIPSSTSLIVNRSASWKTPCVSSKMAAKEPPFPFLSPSFFSYTPDEFHSQRITNFLRANLLRLLLSPTPHLHHEMEKFLSHHPLSLPSSSSSLSSLSPSPFSSFIAVHIRLGDKVIERAVPKPGLYLHWAKKLAKGEVEDEEGGKGSSSSLLSSPSSLPKYVFLSTETELVVDYFRQNIPEGVGLLTYDYRRIEKSSPTKAAQGGDLIPSLVNLFSSQWAHHMVLFPDSHWSVLMYYMQITRGDGGGGGWGEGGRKVLLGTHPKNMGGMEMLLPRVGEKKKGWGEGVVMVRVGKGEGVGKESTREEIYEVFDD